ncbi:hypothetical protein QZH41_013647 [Actinostola sp. cb2023]|nr:hypothetical protein QZH41_013647 [Actinostola sp. cb2023]
MASESVLSHYWDLASTNEDVRVKAACGLVNSLIEAQNQHVKESDNEDTLCADLDYSLKRLSKGLASSRKGARQGFAAALAEILHQFECVHTEQVMELLEKSLQVTGNAKSQEERDAYIGHIFGLMSVVKSYDLSENTKASECTWLAKVVIMLKQLSEKKSYLKEICMKSIVDIISTISFDVFEEYVLPSVNDFIYGGWSNATPDSLLIALCTQRKFGKQFDKKKFKKAWNSSSIVDAQNYSKMPNILQETTNVHPNVHCVWNELFLQIYEQEKAVNFKEFWTIVIDNGLFMSSHGKKYLGFSLIAMILPKLKENQVPIVFSKTIVKSFLNNLSSSQNYLHNAAKYLASSMSNGLSQNEDPNVTASVIQHLLGKQGNIQFDKLTKTKTVESLLGKLQGSGLERVVVWLIDCFKAGYTNSTEDERPSEREVDFIRLSILNQILSLGKNKNLCQSGEWMKKLLFFLIETTYFEKVQEKDKLLFPLSKQVKEVSEQRLLSFIKELGTVSHSGQEGLKTRKSSKSDDEQNWMFTILKHTKELLDSDDHKTSTPSWSDKTKKSFDSALKIVTKIHKKHECGNGNAEDEAFQLLLSHMTLQLFMDPEQAAEILDEVKSCYKNRQEKDEDIDTDEPHWVEVLTEILLSLLTRPSNLLRHVVDEVFTAIAPHLTQDALRIIIQAVDARSLGEGGDEMLEVEDGSDDEEMDNEELEQDKTNGTKSDQDNDDDESDDDDESEEEENNEVDEAFRAEVQAALGDGAVAEDVEGSDDDDDLDDEAMQQFDEALAEVFRSRGQGAKEKKNKKDKAKIILHFKLRVLDIIEIFIKKQPSNPLILDLIEPLLSLVWSSINSKDYGTLGERAQGIYRNKLCAIREHPSSSDVDSEEIHNLLETLIQKSMSAPSLNIVTLVTKGCMLLIRVLKGKPQQQQSETPSKKRKHKAFKAVETSVGLVDVPRVAALFKEALKDFMEKRTSHLHPVLFTELINRYQFLAWELAPDLVKSITNAVNSFRKMQACVMLSRLLSHKCPLYEQHIKTLAPPLQETLQTILEESSQEGTNMKSKHFKEVLKLMTKFLKEIKSLEAEHVIERESLKKALKKSLDGILASRSQDVKSSCTRLIAAIDGSSDGNKLKSSKSKKQKDSHSNGHATHPPDETKTKQDKKKKIRKKKDGDDS